MTINSCFYLSIFACALVTADSPERLPAQGFSQGMLLKSKKMVTLHRKLPAVVHLKDGTLGIKTVARDPKDTMAVQKLADTLQAELLKYNNQFKVDENKPDTLVVCNITDLIIPGTKVVVRSVPTTVKNGNKWTTVQQQKQFQEVNGTIDVAYEVTDVKSGKVLDADNLAGKYHQEFDAGGNKTDSGNKTLLDLKKSFQSFGKKSTEEKTDNTPPTPAELQQILVGKIVQQVTARLTTTDEKVDVELARGAALDQYNDFAEKGLWNRMLEPLETMKPLNTPEEDSFRLYNVGVGYEALAYAAEDVKIARKYLDEAAVNYGKAVDADPHQKEFLDAQNRIATAQGHYAKLGAQAVTSKGAAPVPEPQHPKEQTKEQPSPSLASTGVKAAAGDDTLTNAVIIEMVKSGMDEENLVGFIKEAPKSNFDLSPSGMMELVKGGVKGKVLTAVRARAHPVAAPPHRSAAPAKTPVAKSPTP